MISLLKNQLRPESPFHFFDVSVILPFYENLFAFTENLAKNVPHYQRNGIEVIVVIDDPSEEEGLLNFIRAYPFVNWKVIVNRQKQEQKNPSRVINVGIRNSSMKYVMVMFPASELYTDTILQLREHLMYYPNHFAIGQVSFTSSDSKPTLSKESACPFGNIMVEKCFLEELGGYDESLNEWGGDDDICARLEIIGVRKIIIKEVLFIHRKRPDEVVRRAQKNPLSTEKRFRVLHPPKVNPNGDNWGYDFSEICYDWQTDRFNSMACNSYLKQFLKHSKLTDEVLKAKRDMLLLVPIYNESELLSDFINHMSRFCDGMIFLDDGSSDGSYEQIQGDKMLLKVKKKRDFFNDLGNRNILLDIAYYFNTEWLVFMDVDERFDERYCDLKSLLTQNENDIFAFKFVHLWDSYDTYNTDFPRTEEGIVKTNRMFRSKGHLQINSHRTLHFPSVPYFDRINMDVPILVLHSGNLSEVARQKKYRFYQREDKTKEVYNYEYLICKNCTLKSVNDIQLQVEGLQPQMYGCIS